MASPITGIDHVLAGVADLEGSRATYERLGFTLTPRGRHKGRNTGNYCIMFPGDYIELLGIVDDDPSTANDPFTSGLTDFLAERGEGLSGLALAADDADATYAAFVTAGVKTDPPRALSRLLELPEGTVEPKFTLVHTPPETFPGARFFVCHHLTPDLLRRPDWLDHANDVQRITALTAIADDAPAVAAACARVFGDDAVEADGTGYTIALGGGAALRLDPASGDTPPGLTSLTLAVADTAATGACLEAAGVPYQRDGGDLVVAPEFACGAGLIFTGA
jgi:catechol 2,3-dioxygenase-like lactoylglutathione lyase family enzyme